MSDTIYDLESKKKKKIESWSRSSVFKCKYKISWFKKYIYIMNLKIIFSLILNSHFLYVVYSYSLK